MPKQFKFWTIRTTSPTLETAPPVAPYGYRETPIVLPSGQQVMVAGLAKLDDSLSAQETCQYLKERGIKLIFGMHVRRSYLEAASRHEIGYVALNVPDFTAPGVEIYDQVFEALLSQGRAGKKVAIHCHGGLGRTGTVLAALKLREMSMNDSFHGTRDDLNYSVEPKSSCTKNVRDAIEFIRSIPGSEHAIEDESQVESLIDYELVLKQRHLSLPDELYRGM